LYSVNKQDVSELLQAENLRINPLYFALPATIAPSFAFMLPVATPPNAIVYESGAISIRDMACTGFFLNWICIAITLINVNTWASILFSLSEYPDFAAQSGRNSTCIL
jgi:sodium-dependent dicarboxylate transporter 2/3/5